MADPPIKPPTTTDHTRWRQDLSQHPPPRCTVEDCTRPAVALGYCHIDAAVALVNAGVIRRRARQLLQVLASDADLTVHGDAWLAGLQDATAALTAALDSNPTDQPEPTMVPDVEAPSEATSPNTHGACTSCGVPLRPGRELDTGRCVICARTTT